MNYDMQQKSSSQTSPKPETVLVMQAGGSLGAYECGVCKILSKHDIEFDIIAGTSIGAINATIIAAGYSKKEGIRNSVKRCEDFWMDLAENIALPSFLPYKQRSELAAVHSLFYGNTRAFTPLWVMPGGMPFYYFFNSPYLYDISRLKNTIGKYVDFTELERVRSEQKYKDRKDNGNNSVTSSSSCDNGAPRLILTATNVQTGESVIFDSNDIDIKADHVIASAGYALYGLPWTKVNESYLWDGSFVYNTPLRAVTKASPKYEKIAYVTDVFPRKQEKLPANMPETYHRVRDLLFTDRSIQQTKEISDSIKKHLSLIEQMHELIMSNNNPNINIKDAKVKSRLDKIEEEYNNLVHNERGLIMDRIIQIQRIERAGRHFIFEDADFSIDTITELIKQGEEDAEDALK